MNYIYFNEKGRLKRSNVEDLYAGSKNTDLIYIFADFDKEAPSDYEASLSFRRSDGAEIGPIECLPGVEVNPVTNESMRCFSFLLGSDVLNVAGPLQISARYHSTYIDDISGLEEEAVKAIAMIVANVNETVPITGGASTAILNINRKIIDLNEKVNNHIEDFETFSGGIEAQYGARIEVDSAGNIILYSGNDTVLSSVRVPTSILNQMPGTLVHSGVGHFILEANKDYLITRVGSPTIYLDIYQRSESGIDSSITHVQKTFELVDFVEDFALKASITQMLEHEPSVPEVFDVSVTYKKDGIEDIVTANQLNLGMQTGSNHAVLGLNSVGYYEVREL